MIYDFKFYVIKHSIKPTYLWLYASIKFKEKIVIARLLIHPATMTNDWHRDYAADILRDLKKSHAAIYPDLYK